MKSLTDLHHALVLAGLPERMPEVLAYIAEYGCPDGAASPDVLLRTTQSFGIDDARSLSEFVTLRPLILARRVAVIAAVRLTPEAQHALLKTLEEPRGALIALIVPQPELLLPTLRSRLLPLSIESTHTHKEKDLAREFLKADQAKRLAFTQELAENAKGDDQDLAGLVRFLDALETELSHEVTSPAGREGLRALYRAKRVIAEPGASIKPLLEQVALLVPTRA